ncbi:MAG: dTDP-4-dehydrorhamnose 3,5-epimerase [Planctomycetota bacterium]|jgi:dTDP-4-dehydrorhamnose 3,5-epimerase
MIFTETKLRGAFIIEMEPIRDTRGYFARAWCKKEFEEHGLKSSLVQANITFSREKGTLRGMHYQAAPYQEAKVVRCIKGAIFDVIIDLRPDSPTYREWISAELTENNCKMFYVPEDFAHGYQTLEQKTEVFYQVSQCYRPESEAGIRWNDPQFGIRWPLAENLIISEKDKKWPDFLA